MGTFSTIIEFIKLILKLLDWFQANKDEKWFRDVAFSVKLMNEAKTPDEKKRAITAVATSWSQLG